MADSVRKFFPDFRWEDVDVLPYKEDGTHFKSITRQVVYRGEGDLNLEWRYFEIGPGGHSTLERHQHQHAVMVFRGEGQVFVGDAVTPIGVGDFVQIAPCTWHQFRATSDAPLGFLCLVANDRDRPQRPTPADLEELRKNDGVASFIRF
jgi:quercetin dioxygenase-like cupin family protein